MRFLGKIEKLPYFSLNGRSETSGIKVNIGFFSVFKASTSAKK